MDQVRTGNINALPERPRFGRYYLLACLLALAMLVMMGYSFFTAKHIVNVYIPLIHATTDLQKNVAISHQTLEEVLSGDTSENTETVFEMLSFATQDANALIDDASKPRAGRIEDPATLDMLVGVKEKLAMLTDITRARLADPGNSGPGTEIDRRYDAVFDAVIFLGKSLEEDMHRNIARDMLRFDYTQEFLAVISIILALIIGVLIYILHRKQHSILSELQSTNDNLLLEQRALKKLSDELEKHRNQLEDIVEERTAEIEKALRAAEISSRAKSDFVSSMSHELRTPLNAITGFAQLLAMNPDRLSDEERDSVNEILLAANLLLELVNDLLDLSTIESGKLELSMETIPLNSVLAECASLMQVFAQNQHVSLELHAAADNDMVIVADRRRFKQVILNLLSNAIKYNYRNGKVTLETLLLENRRIRILIRDTGRGIEEKYRQQIFRPFERVASDKAAISGTGIGLVIAKALIESMNGEIGFESVPERGSIFWVELPAAVRNAA